MKNITQALKVIALALILSFGISYVYAWTAPTVTPPGGNVSAPINTSATSQYKEGALGVGGLLKGFGNIQAVTQVESPRYCIGASCITSWPTGGVTPPAGSEFLDTSATAQTKAGDLKVSGSIGIGLGASNPAQKLDVAGSAQITGTIFGGGAQTTYGATTVRGAKNGWSGINFAASSGANNGTLMMHPSYSGFYNAADNNWRMYVTDAGNVYANDYYSNVSGKLASATQSRVTGSCPSDHAINAINADGSVNCVQVGSTTSVYTYSGNNPTCPAGLSILSKKWAAKTCYDNYGSVGCTTPILWSLYTPTCNYMDGGGDNSSSRLRACTATNWTEVRCI